MEANELYNFSISPLVTSPFALEWSQDNHVSLITERGVHVFELVPHPSCVQPTLRFLRTFIYPTDHVPAEAYAKFVNEALWKMKRDEIYQLLLQEAVTPNIEEKTCLNPRITKVAWSPAGLVEPFNCLATILTSAGAIEILYKLGDKWLSVWNLTQRRAESVNEESKIDPACVTESSFDKRRWPEHVKRLLGSAIVWSPLFRDDKPFAYLAAAFHSSELVVARVERTADISNLEESKIVHERSLGESSRIDQLLWIALPDGKRHVVAIGYLDGRIHGLRVTENNGKLEDGILLRYENHADRAQPGSLRSIARENGNHVILVTKRSYLVVLNLDSNGECARTRYLKVDGFSITGLTIVGKDRVMLTTQNCRMYIATVEDERDLTYERLSHDLKTRKVQYLGTAGSPNASILLNVTSPDSIYDHLVNREPSTLQVFALTDDLWNPWCIISEKVRSNRPLREYWDCLEALRLMAAKSPEPSKLLPEIPTSLDCLSIHELRIVFGLTLISQIHKKQFPSFTGKMLDHISEAQSLIFLISGCEHLAHLARKSILTEEEKRSASFLRMYMEICLAGEDDDDSDASPITRKINATFRESSHVATIETEACNLCGEVLSELPWTIDTCPLGHKLPRCSLSLLQITTIRYRSCPICERLFHPSLDHQYEVIRCLYCDVPAAYDPRVPSNDRDDLKKKWKNLSQRPEAYNQAENSRVSHDPDNPNGVSLASEKNKRRCLVNPETFAVIVNGDANGHSLITETWQKF